MRRDMDLVRSILLKVGESEGCVDARELDVLLRLLPYTATTY